MNQIASMGSIGIYLGIFSSLMLAVCLYFSLTYFEHLKYGDDRLIKQSKLIAVISLVTRFDGTCFFPTLCIQSNDEFITNDERNDCL